MTNQKKDLTEKWVDIVREWHKDDPYPPVRPLVKKITQALQQQREEILTTLYWIRANLPLTEGAAVRKQIKVLITKLEKEND